jgi:two-component system, OmpR family, response regulator
VRLLIVEDEVPLAATLERGLRADGFACDIVHDGAQGLARATAASASYDAVVLDLLLPGMNGFTVCRRLREVENWTPVLILTAKDGDYDLAEALESGADDFLSKPFSFVVLTARLRALVRRGNVARPPALVNGGIRLDPFTGACTVSGTAIHLTPREVAVLAVLMRRHPGVVGKDELLAEVWGSDFERDANIVDVYVGHLRRKLTGAAAGVRIANLRGLGFRTEVDAAVHAPVERDA